MLRIIRSFNHFDKMEISNIIKPYSDVTFKRVILKFASSALKIECLSMYRIMRVFDEIKNFKTKM